MSYKDHGTRARKLSAKNVALTELLDAKDSELATMKRERDAAVVQATTFETAWRELKEENEKLMKSMGVYEIIEDMHKQVISLKKEVERLRSSIVFVGQKLGLIMPERVLFFEEEGAMAVASLTAQCKTAEVAALLGQKLVADLTAEVSRLEAELENENGDICEQRNKAEATLRECELTLDKMRSENAIRKEKVEALSIQNLALREALADLIGYMADLVVTDPMTEETLESALKQAKKALTSPNPAEEEIRGRLEAGRKCAEALEKYGVHDPHNADFMCGLCDAIATAKDRGLI